MNDCTTTDFNITIDKIFPPTRNEKKRLLTHINIHLTKLMKQESMLPVIPIEYENPLEWFVDFDP